MFVADIVAYSSLKIALYRFSTVSLDNVASIFPLKVY